MTFIPELQTGSVKTTDTYRPYEHPYKRVPEPQAEPQVGQQNPPPPNPNSAGTYEHAGYFQTQHGQTHHGQTYPSQTHHGQLNHGHPNIGQPAPDPLPHNSAHNSAHNTVHAYNPTSNPSHSPHAPAPHVDPAHFATAHPGHYPAHPQNPYLQNGAVPPQGYQAQQFAPHHGVPDARYFQPLPAHAYQAGQPVAGEYTNSTQGPDPHHPPQAQYEPALYNPTSPAQGQYANNAYPSSAQPPVDPPVGNYSGANPSDTPPPAGGNPASNHDSVLRRLYRATRTAIGGFILLAIISGLLIPQVLPVSGNSVVNAKLEWIRTPIQGELNLNGLMVGDTVNEGQELATVSNTRADDNFLNQLKSEQSSLEASLFALRNKKTQLQEREQSLQKRVNDSLGTLKRETKNQLNIIESELDFLYAEIQDVDARILRYEDANHEYSTSEAYAVVSRTTLDDLYTKRTAIQAKISGQLNTQDILESNLKTALRGSHASTKAPPEQQKLIETGEEIRQVETEILTLSLKLKKASDKINERSDHLDSHRSHKMIAQKAGTVWDIAYADKSFVNNGDTIVAIADSDSMSVEGNFHQRYLDNIEVGDHATIDLMGSDAKLTGTVTEVKIRDQIKSADLSAFNFGNPATNEFKVVVSLTADQSRLPHIGQRAKLIISKSPSSPLPHILMLFNR